MNRRKISCLLAATMLMGTIASCSSSSDERDRGNNRETLPGATATAASETTSETDAPVPDISVTPAQTETEDTTPVSNPVTITDTGIYSNVMAFIDEQHQADPNAKFAITDEWDYWGIWVESNGSIQEYRYVDEQLTPTGRNEADFWYVTVDYDVIRKYPTLCEVYAWVGSEEIIEVVDHVPDGVYFGGIVAVSEDCSSAFITLGNAVTRPRDELARYNVGDTIYIEEIDYDFVVSDIGDNWIDNEDFEPWFANDYTSCLPDSDVLMLMTASDNPFIYDKRLAVLPIDPDCKITDIFSILSGTNQADPSLNTGNVLSQSYYWTYMMRDEPVSIEHRLDMSNNGYINAWGLLYPVVVREGRIVEMNIEWR